MAQKEPYLLKFAVTQEIASVLRQTLRSLEGDGSLAQGGEDASQARDCGGETRGLSERTSASLREQLPLIESLLSSSEGALVPYTLLRDCCSYLRGRKGGGAVSGSGPWLHLLVRGSALHLPQPPRREKSPELVARLAKLQEQQEWKEYNALVKDVDTSAGESGAVFMASFKHQAAFGLNVVTLMLTGYIVGHVAMAHLYRNQSYLHPVGGVIGLIISMMVEVVLYVIIAEKAEERERLKAQRKTPAAPAKPAAGHQPLHAELFSSPMSRKEGPRRRRAPPRPNS